MLYRISRSFRKLLFLGKRSSSPRELTEEIELHRLLVEQDLRNRGLSLEEAYQLSKKQMGNMTSAKEDSCEIWHFPAFELILQDLRHALRALARNPVFSLTAILSLALGIGANTAIFTAVDALLLKPLPVKDPASLVTFSIVDAQNRSKTYFPLSFANRLKGLAVFSDLIATNTDGLSLTVDGRAERIMAEVVTANFFTALGLKAGIGQAFTSDVVAGKWAPEVVLSYSFWKARFGGDPRIIGRVIRLNTYPFTIVGVSSSCFFDTHQGQDPDLRLLVLPPGRDINQIGILSANQEFDFMARLAPGVSRAQAEVAAQSQVRDFIRTTHRTRYEGPGSWRPRLLSGERGWTDLANGYRSPILILLLMVLVAFLIGCANVASMLLARATVRQREFAVRSSLGAGRLRLIRHILVESLLLAVCGGLVGLAVAHWVAQFLLHFLPQGHIHFVLDLHLDLRAAIFSLLLSILAALLFGLTAALQSTMPDLCTALKTDSNASVGGHTILRRALISFQIAFSLALLVVAGLFLRTVYNLRAAAEYADARNILVFTMKPQDEIYNPARVRAIVADLIGKVSSIPGAQAAGIAENGPFASRIGRDDVEVPGRPGFEVSSDEITPGLLKAIGIPILSGRDFNDADKVGSPKVVILSARLAQMLFPQQNALGRTVVVPSLRGSQRFRIIGIVSDIHYYDVHSLQPLAFFAYQNDPLYMPTLHVRVATPTPDAFVPVVRRAFDSIDTGFPVFNIRTLDARIQDAIARERMIADLSSAFGGLALILAAIGMYGVLAYSVARRTREIGVRRALGSQTTAILWLIAREPFTLVGIGAACGLLVSFAAGKLLSSRLSGVTPGDPKTLLVATAALSLIAIAATTVPALKAARVDPLTALRDE